MDCTFSASAWHDLLKAQNAHHQHNRPSQHNGDTMGSFSFAFLANFTSTTGFVQSFDCGTLVERKLVIRSCATTETDRSCLGDGERCPADICSAENTDNESHTVAEAPSHI